MGIGNILHHYLKQTLLWNPYEVSTRTALSAFPAVTPWLPSPCQHSNSGQSWVTSANHAIQAIRRVFRNSSLLEKMQRTLQSPASMARYFWESSLAFILRKVFNSSNFLSQGTFASVLFLPHFRGLISELCLLLRHSVPDQTWEDWTGFFASIRSGTGETETSSRSKATSSLKVLELYLSTCGVWGLSLYYLRKRMIGDELGRKPSVFLFTLTSWRIKRTRFGVRQTCVQFLALSLTSSITYQLYHFRWHTLAIWTSTSSSVKWNI